MALLYEALKPIHDKTLADFAEKFNASPVAKNIACIVSVVDTGMADAVLIDLNTGGQLTIDWERLGSKKTFKPDGIINQQERKIRPWTDAALQINSFGDEIALGFTSDFAKSPSREITVVKCDRDDSGKALKDDHGNLIGAEKIPIMIKTINQYGVWNISNIDNFKLFIANALNHGYTDKAAFADHSKNGAVKSGHVYIKSDLAESYPDLYKSDPHLNSEKFRHLSDFADKFNQILGWNSSVSNVVFYPYLSDSHDGVFINLENNQVLFSKFSDEIDWSNQLQFDPSILTHFKDAVADALGVGYSAPLGHYKDIDRDIENNDIKGLYGKGSKEAKEMDRVRRYSIEISKPFSYQTVELKAGFTTRIKTAEDIYFNLKPTEYISLEDRISTTYPLAGRPKKIWDSFSFLPTEIKKKQKEQKKNNINKKIGTYGYRQTVLLDRRNDMEQIRMPKFAVER